MKFIIVLSILFVLGFWYFTSHCTKIGSTLNSRGMHCKALNF